MKKPSFLEKNLETYTNSRNRLFVEFYSTGQFELQTCPPSINTRGIRSGVLEQLLVMRRTPQAVQKGYSQHVHILPLIDNNEESEQIKSGELKTLMFSSNMNNSIFVIPHSIHNYLSDDLTPLELQCISQATQFGKEYKTPVVFTKEHMKLLKKMYGFDSMPYLSQGKKNTKIEMVNLANARNGIFSSLHSNEPSEVDTAKRLNAGDSMYKYRTQRQVEERRRINIFSTITQSKKIDMGKKLGTQEVTFERPYDRSNRAKINREEHLKLKKQAAEFIRENDYIQGSLF